MAEDIETKYYCGKCEQEIPSTTTVCPHCGSDLKQVHRRIEMKINAQLPPMQAQLRAKQERPGIKKALMEILQRSKISGTTKRPAEESFVVDRTGQKTRVFHKVQELDEHGNWVTVHNEEKP